MAEKKTYPCKMALGKMSSSATSITMPLRGFFGVLARCCNTRIPTSASRYSSGAWRVQQVGVYLRHPDASAYSCLSGSPALPRSHLAASSGSLAAFSLFSVASSACLHACVYIGRAAGVCMREFFSRALATWLLRVYRGIGYLCMRPGALIYLISLYADSEESQQPLEYV